VCGGCLAQLSLRPYGPEFEPPRTIHAFVAVGNKARDPDKCVLKIKYVYK